MTNDEKYGVTNDEIMDFLKKNMVTKDELTYQVGKLRSDIIDFIDKKLLDLKGGLVVLMKTENKMLLSLIEILVQKSVLSDSASSQSYNA